MGVDDGAGSDGRAGRWRVKGRRSVKDGTTKPGLQSSPRSSLSLAPPSSSRSTYAIFVLSLPLAPTRSAPSLCQPTQDVREQTVSGETSQRDALFSNSSSCPPPPPRLPDSLTSRLSAPFKTGSASQEIGTRSTFGSSEGKARNHSSAFHSSPPPPSYSHSNLLQILSQ